MRTAERYVRDTNMAVCVHSSNAASGLAFPRRLLPATADLLHGRNQINSSIEQANIHSNMSKRQWSRRWRMRVGANLGKFYVREDMDLQVKRDKA